jgi:RecB family exonuclease
VTFLQVGVPALEPLVLLVPSLAAAVELPRRLASTGRALAGVYALRIQDLARALAEPALLGSGLQAWDAGHGALLASRLLADGGLSLDASTPRGPVARLLARTLASLRQAQIPPRRLSDLGVASPHAEDARRLEALAGLLQRHEDLIEGHFADPAALLRTAASRCSSSWLGHVEILVVDDLELEPLEESLLAALASATRVRRLEHALPRSLVSEAFPDWASRHEIPAVPWSETPLAPLAPPPAPPGLARLGACLFEPPAGEPVRDGSVELLTAPGEAAEVKAIARRLLREAARGVSFEDMGVVLPRPDDYAALVSDLFGRLDIPFRLHPSLPLHTGRAARSLLLLFRCRGLTRAAVMEFLTFAPVPYDSLLGEAAEVSTLQWEEASRNAGVTSGLDRWRSGLTAYAATKRGESERAGDGGRRDGALRRATAAASLLQIVEALASTLDELSGERSWAEWSRRLLASLDRWVGDERDREAVAQLLADLAGLGAIAPGAEWTEVESVIETRFEWERVPMDPPPKGGVHVGALDAVAGLPFRVLAIPGLVEGGYPGPIRPDPFLLDAEREALSAAAAQPTERSAARQLSLFDAAPPAATTGSALPTSQLRLLEQRRLFHRALRQATERLILCYPRADPRTGRERLPSLFFVAAASALGGRALDMGSLASVVVEDDLRALDVDDATDRGERDRCRRLRGGTEAVLAIAGGAPFFKHSLLADSHRWMPQVTSYDGFVDLPAPLRARLDPTSPNVRLSATRLHTYADCGFRYLLDALLHLEPVEEPEDRTGLDPLERGQIFHEVAERFLRERRQRGELPVRDTPETQGRLMTLAEEALASLVAGSPPRHRLLWDMARERLFDLLQRWLAREASSGRGTPAHFEVAFGLPRDDESDDPYSPEPLVVDLGDGRALRVIGRIDRIDLKADGTLVVRDYKAGRAPKDEVAAGYFRGGRQLQIPFYVRAAAMLFPERSVSEAFLDYVDGGRMVSFDPQSVSGERFLGLLRPLVEDMAAGLFLQDANACRFCDFTRVCGPPGLIAARQQRKRRDRRAARVFGLKETP